MNNKWLIVPVMFIASLSAKAQPFEIGSNVVNVGIGFGWSYSYFSGADASPAISLGYELGYYELENVGILGIGGVLGFKNATDRYYNYKVKWNDFYIGPKAAIHMDLFNEEKLDTYGGVILGLRFQSYENSYFDATGQPDHYDYGGSFYTYFGSSRQILTTILMSRSLFKPRTITPAFKKISDLNDKDNEILSDEKFKFKVMQKISKNQ